MKAASACTFSIDFKYSKIANLIIAYVWGVRDHELAVTYALTYREVIVIADGMGWTATDSWRQGNYFTSAPSKKLHELLEPYRMSPEAWWRRIAGSANDAP